MMADLCVGPPSDPDRITLGPPVASGAEGVLYRGTLRTDAGDIPVAVKMLQPGHLHRLPEWAKRWQTQAELLERVKLPGIVAVRDAFVGALPHPPGNADESSSTLYLVMDWIDGIPLDQWARNVRDAEPEQILQVLVPVAAALDVLHSGVATGGVAVIHRDVKPSNILIRPGGDTVLVDVGSIRGIDDGARRSGVSGTLGYIAPEVMSRGDFSPASDRYALGAVAFFLLTGDEPPIGAPMAELRARLEAAQLLSGRRDVVDHVVAMLEDDPDKRPTVLANWVAQLRRASLSVLPGDVVIAPRAPGRNPSSATTPTSAPKSRIRLGAAALALTVAAAAAFVVTRDEPADTSAPAPKLLRLAFVETNDIGQTAIFTSLSDGSERSQVTQFSWGAESPAWSPDATQIAYIAPVGTEDHGAAVFVVHVDGRQPTYRTGPNDQMRDPAWSPDGKTIIAARSDVGSDPSEIVVIEESGGLRELTHDSCGSGSSAGSCGANSYASVIANSSPAFSPDGGSIAYVKRLLRAENPETAELHVMNRDGSDDRIVDILGGGAPSWSPDGARLAYYASGDGQGGGVYSIRPDGTDRRLETTCCEAEPYGLAPAPVWGPDGKSFLRPGAGGIFAVTRNGSSVRKVRSSGARSLTAAPLRGPIAELAVNPAVCPAGTDCLAVGTPDLDGDGDADRLALFARKQQKYAVAIVDGKPTPELDLGEEVGGLFHYFLGFHDADPVLGVDAFVVNGHGTDSLPVTIVALADGALKTIVLPQTCNGADRFGEPICYPEVTETFNISTGADYYASGFECTKTGFVVTDLSSGVIADPPTDENVMTWRRQAFTWDDGNLAAGPIATGTYQRTPDSDPERPKYDRFKCGALRVP